MDVLRAVQMAQSQLNGNFQLTWKNSIWIVNEKATDCIVIFEIDRRILIKCKLIGQRRHAIAFVEKQNVQYLRRHNSAAMIWICKWAVCFSTCLLWWLVWWNRGKAHLFFPLIRLHFPHFHGTFTRIPTDSNGFVIWPSTDNNKEGSSAGRSNRRSLIRTASTDELEVMLCLNQLCLANGHVPGKDFGCLRLMAYSAGFYGLALALVSHLTRTRSLALRVIFKLT